MRGNTNSQECRPQRAEALSNSSSRSVPSQHRRPIERSLAGTPDPWFAATAYRPGVSQGLHFGFPNEPSMDRRPDASFGYSDVLPIRGAKSRGVMSLVKP